MAAPAKLPRGVTRYRGRYRVRVDYEGRTHSLGMFDTLTDARAALDITRGQIARGRFVPPAERRSARKAEVAMVEAQSVTLKEWSEKWLAALEANALTLRAYRGSWQGCGQGGLVMRFKRTVPIAVASLAALAAAMAPMAHAGDPGGAEAAKVAAEAGAGARSAAGTAGDAAALAQEGAARDGALSEDVSPGAFSEGGQVVSRVFADSRVAGSDRARASVFTKASLADLMSQIEGLRATSKRADVAYGFYYDAANDMVRIDGNLDASAVAALSKKGGAIKFVKADEAGRDSRASDGTPHWGGARITSGGAGCSSGFIVKNSAGTRFALTAAHCGGLNSQWYSGTNYFGKMTSRGPFPAYDMALLSGSSYGSYIYMGGSTGTGWRTGAASNPAVGATYCTSGTTTNENCGKVVQSLSASFCDSSGCTYGLASYTGGTSTAGGDSGGPLVLKGSSTVYPRGIHIARAGSTMYAEKWSTISSHLGVPSVTS